MRIDPSRFGDGVRAWTPRAPRTEINAALRALLTRQPQARLGAAGAERSHWGVGRTGEHPVASDTGREDV